MSRSKFFDGSLLELQRTFVRAGKTTIINERAIEIHLNAATVTVHFLDFEFLRL